MVNIELLELVNATMGKLKAIKTKGKTFKVFETLLYIVINDVKTATHIKAPTEFGLTIFSPSKPPNTVAF